MFEEIFRRKKVVFEELETYGFEKIHNTFQYDTDILNDEFHLRISIGRNKVPDTKLTENAAGEEYVLYKTNTAGKYVAAVLQSIADRCYEAAVFKADQSVKLIAKYGDELEYLWVKFPDSGV